jgi:hypothetical protein
MSTETYFEILFAFNTNEKKKLFVRTFLYRLHSHLFSSLFINESTLE